MTFACTLSQNQPEHLKELLHEHCCQHCVPGQPAASDEGSLTQILSDKPLQRENFSSSLCLTPTLIHPLQLFCSASTAPIIFSVSIRLPLLFYLPRITLVLHYLCLSFFFCSSFALTSLQHCSQGEASYKSRTQRLDLHTVGRIFVTVDITNIHTCDLQMV